MSYNGYKNYDYWNVSLWMANDEGLYNIVRRYKRRYKTLLKIAKALKNEFDEMGFTHTPDGVKITIDKLRVAIRDL